MPPHDSETTARRVDEMQARLVPEGPAPTGSVVGVVGQNPFQYDWTSPPGAEIRRGRGDPNGSETAPIGTPYTDLDGPTFWLNSDGVQGWDQVGRSAGSGFPVGPTDDGTSTAQILHVSPGTGIGELLEGLTSDADGNINVIALYAISATDSVWGVVAQTDSTKKASVSAQVSGTGALGSVGAAFGGRTAEVSTTSDGTASTVELKGDQVRFTSVSGAAGAGVNVATALPTTDPAVNGQLWMDPATFVVMVSQG